MRSLFTLNSLKSCSFNLIFSEQTKNSDCFWFLKLETNKKFNQFNLFLIFEDGKLGVFDDLFLSFCKRCEYNFRIIFDQWLKKFVWMFECGTWKSNFEWTLLFSCCCWLLTSNWDRHASPVKRSMACHDNSNKYVRTKETCEITHPIPIQLYFAKKRRKPRRGGICCFLSIQHWIFVQALHIDKGGYSNPARPKYKLFITP